MDPLVPLIVTSDLGAGPSLADALLGDRPDDAVAALLGWAAQFASIAAETAVDNNVITPDGIRLLDFEGAGFAGQVPDLPTYPAWS